MSKQKRIRKTGKDIRRDYRIFLIGAVLAFVFGLYTVLVFMLNRTPAYEDLRQDTVVVEGIRHVSRSKGVNYYALTSDQGKEYHLTGDFHADTLLERLDTGAEISIKWHARDWLMPEIACIEEIDLDGEVLSTYTNDDGGAVIFAWAGGGVLFALGVAGILFYRHAVAKELQMIPKKDRN